MNFEKNITERLFDRRDIAMWSPNGGGDGSEETIYVL